MKKKFQYLFAFLCFFLISPKLVLGYQHNIVYFVESFNVSSTSDIINLRGYSYISHQDNRGGSNGNLTTSLIAYVGEWKDQYLECAAGNDKCYKISNKDYSGVDHYPLRCTQSYCTATWRSSLNSKSLSSFDEDGNSCVGDPSHCIYHDIGFNFDINLQTLYNYFVQANVTGDLKFRIYSKTRKHSASSDLGVYSVVCRRDGQACSSSTSTANFTFNMFDFATTARMDAIDAYMQTETGYSIQPLIKWHPRGGEENGTYDYSVLGFTYGTSRQVRYADQSLSTGNQPMLHLSGHGLDGWAFVSWVKIPGNLGLKISNLVPKYIKKTCNDIFGSSKITSNTVDCGNTKKYNQCRKDSNISGTIYLKTDSTCSGYKSNIGGEYYIPITVVTDVLLNEEAVFTFGNASPSTVYAGKGFSLESTIYRDSVTWVDANMNFDGTPYYRYIASKYILSGNSCTKDANFNVTANTQFYYYDDTGQFISQPVSLSTASFEVINQQARKKIKKASDVIDKVKFKSCDSNNSDGCTFANPNKEVSGSWIKNNDTEISEYKISNQLFGRTFTDTYNYNLTDSYVVLSGNENGKAEYIKQAEEISESYQATGKKYYIDFKWISAQFPFNLAKEQKPSFLGFDWILNGKCSITVKDGYYTEGEGGKLESLLKYRSINVDNPFPKGNIPSNWQKWWEKTSNQTRIKNSYGDYPDHPLYEITLSKYEIPDAKSISDISNYGEANGNDSYASTKTISLDGSSKFVKLFFSVFVRESDRLYCPLGTFKQECDLGR